MTLGFLGLWGLCYLAFMNAFPRMRVFMLTSPYRDEIQVPVDPKTMEPLAGARIATQLIGYELSATANPRDAHSLREKRPEGSSH